MLFIPQKMYLLSMGTQSYALVLSSVSFPELSNKTIYNVTGLTAFPPADRVHLLSLSVAEAFINTQVTAYYTYTQRRGHFILQLPSVELWFLDCNTQAAQKSHNRALLFILGNVPSFLAYK